jgi:hypothetical protein
MAYRLLVTVILGVHFAFVAYVVFGGWLALRWPWAFWPHLLAAAWGFVVVTFPGVTCPLTAAEDWARQHAGQAPLTQGFIDRYIEGVLYPERYTVLLDILAGLVVVGSWIGVYLNRRHRRRAISG